MEDMPSPCYKSSLGNYTFLTNPFIFYTSIGSNSTRCASHVVPANSGGKSLPDDNLVNALSSTGTASNYMWLTPNLCDNMHNCSIARGDNYLSKLVPLILDSTVFRTEKAALFVTFDEGYGRYPTDYVYTIWTGPTIQHVYQVGGNYTASLEVADTSGQSATTSHTVFIDTDSNPTGACESCTKTTFPRTLGLVISFAIGVVLPLASSMIISRRH